MWRPPTRTAPASPARTTRTSRSAPGCCRDGCARTSRRCTPLRGARTTSPTRENRRAGSSNCRRGKRSSGPARATRTPPPIPSFWRSATRSPPARREALAARRVNAGFRDLLAFEVARTRGLFERGLPLADMVGRRLRHEVRIFARGGLAILARIEAAGYDVFARRPTLGRGDLLRLVVRGLWR